MTHYNVFICILNFSLIPEECGFCRFYYYGGSYFERIAGAAYLSKKVNANVQQLNDSCTYKENSLHSHGTYT